MSLCSRTRTCKMLPNTDEYNVIQTVRCFSHATLVKRNASSHFAELRIVGVLCFGQGTSAGLGAVSMLEDFVDTRNRHQSWSSSAWSTNGSNSWTRRSGTPGSRENQPYCKHCGFKSSRMTVLSKSRKCLELQALLVKEPNISTEQRSEKHSKSVSVL